MKANYIANKSEHQKIAEKTAREEVERQKRSVCPECQMNTVYQTLATVFVILKRRYHHTPEWLNRLKDEIEDEFSLMETGFLGRDYTANQLVQALKEVGVDFSESKYKEKAVNNDGKQNLT